MTLALAAAGKNTNIAAEDSVLKQYIFADESNLNSHFMLIGGVWADTITYKAVIEKCNQFKQSIGWTIDAKFNWKNVSKLTLSNYKKFIDIFFEFNLNFNVIVIDQKKVCLKKNCDNDPELGFYKFYYLLLWHNTNKNDEYYIYLDRKNNKKETRLKDLKEFLIKPRLKDIIFALLDDNEPDNARNIKSIDSVNSKYYNLIQFSDILLGAIGFHYNQRHIVKDASQVKCELAQYIAQKMGVKTLRFITSSKGYKNINIWLFEPNKIKSAL